ncbi:MAG TPA: hypothetical protein VGM76_05475 [Lacipirellulaceae bacterium]|jgi:hypothetical protein
MSAPEIWLRTNRRALCFGAVPPAIGALAGVWLVAIGIHSAGSWYLWIGCGMIVFGLGLVAALLAQIRQPRIAYRARHVLFYVVSGEPIAVPVGIVEAFFLGQGPLMLPGPEKRGDATVNLVARLSQRETQWAEHDVKPALGRWSDGYITIRGTWCEPLNGELVRRLNRRLREVTEESNQ